MIVVEIEDKRFCHGLRLEFFNTDTITEEIINLVKRNHKVLWVKTYDKRFNRDKFLEYYKLIRTGDNE